MTLQEKVQKFLGTTDMPKTTFCKKIDLTPQSLNAWLRGTLNLRDKTLNRITTYLEQFDSILKESE